MKDCGKKKKCEIMAKRKEKKLQADSRNDASSEYRNGVLIEKTPSTNRN